MEISTLTPAGGKVAALARLIDNSTDSEALQQFRRGEYR